MCEAKSVPRASKDTALAASLSSIVPYEARLDQDGEWALGEGSLYFEGQGEVQKAFRKITSRLGELGVSYAVAGAMAMFHHGYRRFTEDIDIIVTPKGLEQIHNALVGSDYVCPSADRKQLRDADSGVRIDFLVTGDFPGDGKQKQIAFPDPASAAVNCGGVWIVSLPTLVELKLASGMTERARLKDLADVQELIKFLRLPAKFAEELHPYVRDTYRELWGDSEEVGPAQREVEWN
jgi:hypothetical protein